jgi:hypothetical protein
MEMQGLKPSVLMGKLIQHLPPGVSPDNNLFLAIFFIRLPPSMTEIVGAHAHKTAAAMVKAADASETGASLPATGREVTQGAVTSVPKPPFPPRFSFISKPWQ